MSGPLAHSMFHAVLFPPALEAESGEDAGAVLTLRRLTRFLPEPTHDVTTSPIVVFDLETTGLDPEADRIIEIGGLKIVRGEVVGEFSALVSTNVELTDEIVRLTGITPEMLAGQPRIHAVLPKFLEFISGCVLVAHNAEFDMSMLRAAASRQGIDLEWACFCTLKMAREFLLFLENRKLDTLAAHYGLTFEARHRAIGDIKVTAGVLAGMLAREANGLKLWSQFANYVVA
jgi:DNA polymerase III epsilon subunit family exonuclease